MAKKKKSRKKTFAEKWKNVKADPGFANKGLPTGDQN
jgi:hypothetical protein